MPTARTPCPVRPGSVVSGLGLAMSVLALAGCVTDPANARSLAMPTPLWSVGAPFATSNILADVGGTLLVQTDSLVAINAVAGIGPAGSVRWKVALGSLPLGGVQLAVSGSRVVFSGSVLQTLDLNTGAVLYTDPAGTVTSLGSTDGTNVFVARSAPAYRLQSLSPTGAIAWSTPLDSVCPAGCRFAGTAVSGDTVYLAGSVGATVATNALVMAFSRTTGNELWRKIDATIDTTFAFRPVVSGKQLVLVTTTGLAAYALNRATRAVTWQRQGIGSPISLTPVAAGDVVLLMAPFGGEAISADSGLTVWSVSGAAPIVQATACPGSIAVASANALLVVERTSGRALNGIEVATFGGGNGSVGAGNGRLYLSTAGGPRLAAYPCP